MQSFPAEATTLFLRADRSTMNQARATRSLHVGRTVRSAVARLAAVLNRRACIEDLIAERHAGRGWSDETERALNHDIANHPYARF